MQNDLQSPDVWLANYYFTHENTPLARLAPDGGLAYASPPSKALSRAIRATPGSVTSNSPCTGGRHIVVGYSSFPSQRDWQLARQRFDRGLTFVNDIGTGLSFDLQRVV
jgi:hypothetical protein